MPGRLFGRRCSAMRKNANLEKKRKKKKMEMKTWELHIWNMHMFNIGLRNVCNMCWYHDKRHVILDVGYLNHDMAQMFAVFLVLKAADCLPLYTFILILQRKCVKNVDTINILRYLVKNIMIFDWVKTFHDHIVKISVVSEVLCPWYLHRLSHKSEL